MKCHLRIRPSGLDPVWGTEGVDGSARATHQPMITEGASHPDLFSAGISKACSVLESMPGMGGVVAVLTGGFTILKQNSLVKLAGIHRRGGLHLMDK